MRKSLIAALLLSACSHARAGTFVTGVPPVALPGPKYDNPSMPVGADPNRWIRGSDYNAVANACVDLRSAMAGAHVVST